MEERYETLKELGSGKFGVARLVRDKKTKELRAVKYIERGKKVIIIIITAIIWLIMFCYSFPFNGLSLLSVMVWLID